MATLSNVELKKYRFLPFKNSEGFRWETFLYYVENRKPFICSPKGAKKVGSTTVILQDRDNLSQKIRKAIHSQDFSKLSNIKLTTEFGQQIVLSDLEKTADFGKSGGMGGGTEQTAIVEAAQCIVCGALSLGHQISSAKLPEGAYSVPDAEKVWDAYLHLSEEWQKATEETARALISYLGEGKWTFRYNDDLVQSILRKFSELKKGNFSGRKDKWNPADIWVSKGDVDISRFTDFGEFSKFCFSENLKGISLKKGGTNIKECPDREAKFEIKNIGLTSSPENGAHLLTWTFTFNGQDQKKLLTVRPDRMHLKAEIKTKGANHRNGSCGQEFISQVYSSLGFGEINLRSEYQELERMQKQDILDHPGDYSEDRWAGAEQDGLDYSINPEENIPGLSKMSPKDLENLAADRVLNRMSNNLKGEKLERFISQISRYCVSSLENSCSYLKVS